MDAAVQGYTFFFDWEPELIQNLQQGAGTVGKALTRVFAFIGDQPFTIIVLMVVLFLWRKESGKRLVIPVMTATLGFAMVKNLFFRLRPYMAHPDKIAIWQLPETDAAPMDVLQQGYSFPSGHSAMSTALYGTLARDVRKKWMWCLAVLVPLCVGISRFIVGAHYPTDVLAGWAMGLLGIGFSILLEKTVKSIRMRYLILTAITLPGLFWCNSRDYFAAFGFLLGLMAALEFEKKYVRFEDTRDPLQMLLRFVGAVAAYVILNKLTKMPFSTEFMNNGTLGSNMVRLARYVILGFVMIGVYPMTFRLYARIGKQPAKE